MTKKICDWWGEKHCFSRILNKCYFNRILGSGKSIWGLPVAVCSRPLFSYIHLATHVGLFPRSAFVCSVTLECFSLAAHFMFSNVYLHPGTDPDFFWGGRRQSAYEWLAPPTWLNSPRTVDVRRSNRQRVRCSSAVKILCGAAWC